jgi:hypothetical protein
MQIVAWQCISRRNDAKPAASEKAFDSVGRNSARISLTG